MAIRELFVLISVEQSKYPVMDLPKIIASLMLVLAFASTGTAQKTTSKAVTPGETLNSTQHGVRMNVEYNPKIEAFTGSLQNVSDEPLYGIRAEVDVMTPTDNVHLGPSQVISLRPGEEKTFTFGTDGMVFESWRVIVVHGER